MHPKYIKNFDAESETVRSLANSGFVMVFEISAFGPAHVHNEFDDDWRRIYEKNSYHARDPIFMRANISDCKLRWSEVGFKIPGITTNKIGIHAAEYGLKFGVILSKKPDYRSFMSCARHDREFTDDEVELLEMKFDRILAGGSDGNALSKEKLMILLKLSEGYNQKTASNELDIKYPTFRLRLKEIYAELNVKTPEHAVAKAVQLKLFDGLK